MSSIMTKRGNQDNIITYEFVCDSTADLQTIEYRYITMGSVAIVIHGETGLEIYMADSQRQWISLGVMNSGGTISSGPESNIVGEGESGYMIIHDGEAASNLADAGQADSMILSA